MNMIRLAARAGTETCPYRISLIKSPTLTEGLRLGLRPPIGRAIPHAPVEPVPLPDHRRVYLRHVLLHQANGVFNEGMQFAHALRRLQAKGRFEASGEMGWA